MNAKEEDIKFMQKAIQEARHAYEIDEVPIGAIIECEGKIIGKGHNQTELLHDVTAHAEMIAITAASQYLNSKYLEECTIYVTVEPCLMCAGAIKNARIKKIVYGVHEPKTGFSNQLKNKLSTKIEVVQGILEEESKSLMQSFFLEKR